MKKETIRELRKEHGLTQQQLADELGVDIRTVQYWEVKGRKVSAPKRKFIAKFFKMEEKDIDF